MTSRERVFAHLNGAPVSEQSLENSSCPYFWMSLLFF
jgi:hypothetical protein